MHSKIKINGRTIHVVDTLCDIDPRLHYVWLGQISPDFACIIGGSEDEAHEYFSEALGYSALNNDEVGHLVEECLADCDGDEERAFVRATHGMLPLNGGAEWIAPEEYGYWHPASSDIALLKIAADVMRGIQN